MGCHISFTILNPLLVLLLALCTFGCSKGCVERERLALLDFKTSFTSSSQNHGDLSSWDSSEECCSWGGITCDNHTKHVVSLDLSYQGLESYKLRPSLIELQHLRELSLGGNDLIATRIPKFIGSLRNIPSCIHDFTAMAHDAHSSQEVVSSMGDFAVTQVLLEDAYYYSAYIKWKSKVWKFQTTLHLVKLIDLSSNNLTGEIPNGLDSLVELDSIDLSCNSLQGSIPAQIGQLKSLQYLNLSSNRLCGQIPQSLSDISALEMLDLSHNNLSGRIPKSTQLQTFNHSAFEGNPDLCGLPLCKCPGDGDDSAPKASPTDGSEIEEKSAYKQCFYAGLGAGFACGFFGILSTLIWIRKWRYAFFQFATKFGEWTLLVWALSKSKISRNLGFK